MFPDDQTLIARGKYSTLNKEWREQVKRVQDICRTLQAQSYLVVKDCEVKPPVDGSHVEIVGKCFENLKDARGKLITLSLGLAELEPDAWPK